MKSLHLVVLLLILAINISKAGSYNEYSAFTPDMLSYSTFPASQEKLFDKSLNPESEGIKWGNENNINKLIQGNSILWIKFPLQQNKFSQFENPVFLLTIYAGEFRVFQGTTPIYEYTHKSEKDDFRYYNYHIIRLKKELGRTLYIAAYHEHPLNSALVINAGIGEERSIHKVLLKEQQKTTSSITVNLVFGILSILAGLFSFGSFIKRYELKEYLLLIFGIFSITGGIRSINSYSFATIINMTQMESMSLFFISIYVLPVLLIAFIDLLLGGKTRLKVLWQFNIIFLLAPLAWYFMHLTFRQTEYFHIAALMVNLIAFPFLIPRESILNKSNKRFIIIVFLMFYVYTVNDILLNSNILQWEISLFIWSLVLVLFAYGFIISRHLQETSTKIKDLKRKNLESQFEALKGQLTPHFLFNTLNTLASVIEENPRLAVEFVEELSNVYRYVLQCKDRSIIELESEVDFIRSYTFLLLKRHQSNLNFTVDVSKEFFGYCIPPLTLQILIENVVKHNIISKKKPLSVCINIENESGDFYISVKNNIQSRNAEEDSFKVGLNNLISRYRYFTSKEIKIISDTKEFIVKVPLLSPKDSI